MVFLKAITTDGKAEYFNAEKILSIQPHGDKAKILMGAGLFWNVKRDSLVWVERENIIADIMEV